MNITELFMGILGVSTLYFFVRRQRNQYLQTSFTLQLYEIRDDLRNMALDKKIETNTRVFSYFEKTISRLIQESYYISLPYLVEAKKKHIEDKALNHKFKWLEHECNDNKNVEKIRSDIEVAVSKYIIEQNKYSFNHFVILAITSLNNSIKTNDFILKMISRYNYESAAKDIFKLPETSAQYIPTKEYQRKIKQEFAFHFQD